MTVVLLLVVIWSVVLVPPALQAHAARKDAFLVSFGSAPSQSGPPPTEPRSTRVRRRRRIAGSLLVAMAATLATGLLSPFRVFLVVHLFLVDSFLAYVALLAFMANRAAHLDRNRRGEGVVAEPEPSIAAPASTSESRRWRRRELPGPGMPPELGPVVRWRGRRQLVVK